MCAVSPTWSDRDSCSSPLAKALRSLPVPGVSTAIGIATRIWDATIPVDRTRSATVARLEHMKAAVSDVQLFLAPSESLRRDVFCLLWTVHGPHHPLQSGNRDGRVRSQPADTFQPAANRLPWNAASKGGDLLIDAIERLPPGRVTLDVMGSVGAYHGEADSRMR